MFGSHEQGSVKTQAAQDGWMDSCAHLPLCAGVLSSLLERAHSSDPAASVWPVAGQTAGSTVPTLQMSGIARLFFSSLTNGPGI